MRAYLHQLRLVGQSGGYARPTIPQRLGRHRLKLSNARAEALNNKVKLIVRRAYGFHSARAALALVHLTCGPVELTLPHEPKFA